MDVRDRIVAVTPDDLARLAFRPEDAAEVLGWRGDVLADAADVRRIQELADGLVASMGNFVREERPVVFDAGDKEHRLGRGVLPVFALLATAPELVASLRHRGVPDEVAWGTAADLGQQVWKGRRVYACAGLQNQDWLQTVWSGGFARLGRLQFELAYERVPGPGEGPPSPSTEGREVVLSVHIPADGRLSPAAVDDSFQRAGPFFARHFPEVGPIRWLVCHSWLLDPVLSEILPGSNLDSFARRWEVWTSHSSDRSAYYFGFDIQTGEQPTPDLDSLPADSGLHRAMIAHWRSGGSFSEASGRIPLP